MNDLDFTAFLRALGLRPRSVVADGRWRRCPTDSHPKRRNGSYKLHSTGRVGLVRDFATHDEPIIWHADRNDPLPAFDVEAFRRADEEHRLDRARAVAEVRAFYETCQPLRNGHAYLEAHDLDMTGCMGLRVDRDGWLVVPAWRGGSLMSVQRIAPTGQKRFWPGAPVTGTQYTIRRGQPHDVTIVCEGLATGLACVAAFMNTGRSARGIVLWDAGNLAKAKVDAGGWIVIAADNDYGTLERTGKNPGVEAATQAAQCLGAGVAYPEGIQGTDWADFRMEKRRERLSKKLPHQTTSAIERGLDGELAGLLMRKAKYVAPGAQLPSTLEQVG